MSGAVSIGVAGTLGPDLIARLAPAVEAAGFSALWINDTPGGDALAALAAAARVTDRLLLATGVLPVDRRSAAAIAHEIEANRVPQHRLVLGIGSGRLQRGALRAVTDAAEVLQARLEARVVVGALGPRMRRLGAERAGGVLLNWVPTSEAAAQTALLHGAEPTAHIAAYVRTALDPAGAERLRAEAAQYERYPHYAANFARLGVDAVDTAFLDEDAVRSGLPAYRDAVDEVVLRAVTPDDGEGAYLDFIARTAPAAG